MVAISVVSAQTVDMKSGYSEGYYHFDPKDRMTFPQMEIKTNADDTIYLTYYAFDTIYSKEAGQLVYTYYILNKVAAEHLGGLLSTDISYFSNWNWWESVIIADPFEKNGEQDDLDYLNLVEDGGVMLYVDSSRKVVHKTKDGKPCLIFVSHK